ncbi:MAG: ribosome-associated translation inhibitor RaiA [Candidatus Paceibacterota bacterium]
MKINLQAKNMEMTDSIYDYVMKKVTNLGKLLDKLEETTGEILIDFNVAKTTNHHKSGEVFQASCSINTKRGNYFSNVDKEDLYEAIDTVKENLFRDINKVKDRNQTLFKRGATSVKKMMKGLTKRNPFTAKY